MKRAVLVLSTLLLLLTTVWPALADGIIIPLPPPIPGPVTDPPWLTIKYHRVHVTIDNQVATTRIDQLFVNEGQAVVEGTYMFPLPQGATVSDFTMWVDGRPIEPQLLEAEEARRIYNDIVRQWRDPALLEYVGTNAIRANVFPIPPGEQRRIEIEYQQVLEVDSGLVHYVYPLNTERFSARPLEEVTVTVEITSNDPMQTVYSPSHRIAVDQTDEFHARVGYEEYNVLPDKDFSLYYTVSPEDIALNLLTYRESADEDGFFMLLIAPPVEVRAEVVIPKDVLIVLDQSGSMAGEKWDQARTAVEYILENLNAEDRFNMIVFSTGSRIYANTLQPPAEGAAAARWVNSLEAIGGTDINGALLRALEMVDPERATVLLFVTDGLPTEGETAIDRILENVRAKAPQNVRLFSFGVGDDVDTFLLDRLAQENRGTSAYVRSGERIDEEIGAWYAKVNAPVLTDIALDFDGMMIEDMYPAEPLPDLFAGTQMVIVGRYRGSGRDVTIRLSGDVNGERQTFVYDGLDFPDRAGGGSGTDAEAFIPRLWATRRIGALLDQIRLQGENKELVDSVIRLSLRYGIITPYTSFLIQEEDIFTQAGRDVILREAQSSMDLAFSQSAGAAAVDAAEAIGGARSAEAPAAMPTMVQTKSGELIDTREVIRQVRDRAFVLREGVWIDTAYDPTQMTTQKVEFLSEAYFELLAQQPALADFFALGERVIVVLEGVAYEVVTG
ncbi:MAG: VWA domain-containing protein [Anaerolineae bacterium]|nr:VWA domain-containing protein [Anaerolineae bacterium]